MKRRLEEAEDVLSSLRKGQVDAVVGKNSVVLPGLAEAKRQLRRNQVRVQTALEASGGALYERAVAPADPTDISDRCSSFCVQHCRLRR